MEGTASPGFKINYSWKQQENIHFPTYLVEGGVRYGTADALNKSTVNVKLFSLLLLRNQVQHKLAS